MGNQLVKIGKSLKYQNACEDLAMKIISQVRIAVVGKYTGLSDAYLSVLKAPSHAYEACRKKLVNYWVPACDLEKESEKENQEAYWKLLKVSTAVVGKYTALSDAYLSVVKAPSHAYEACPKKLVNYWVPACDLEKETEKENPEAYWKLLKIISQVSTAVVEKYTALSDAYLSVLKAPLHAYEACRKKIVYRAPACDLEKETEKESVDAIRVPGGFGDRGVEGKILAAKYARENKIPFLGMQNKSRSVLCLRDANSTEIKPETKHSCNAFMPEVNPDMVERPEKAGLSLAAKGETGKRMEPVDDLRITMNEQENCSDYKPKPKKSQLPRSTIPSKQEVKEDLVKSEKKGNFITEEAVKTEEAFINMIIGCILMLPFIFKTISVSSDMAAKSLTHYSSSSPRFDAKSCRSSTDIQTNSNFSPSPVSYPMRIAVSPGKVHQLFVNFRGEQVRYNFVSHLSEAFQRHQIKFFIDKNEQRGKDLKHLFVRIEESSIALAIFSTRYPESSWCMDELVKMKKLADQGKLLVIPIFYKVEAEDVRKPTSDSEFGKNFWRLAETSSGDQINEWKEALESISYKMGLSLGENSSEADFVKEIIKEVQRVIEAIGLKEE